MKHPFSIAALLFAVFIPIQSNADTSEPASRWITHADVVGRHNPAGVMLLGGLVLRQPFGYDEERKIDDSYLQAGADAGVNPAYAQASLHAEWMPVLPVVVRVQYDLFGFFGKNGAVLSFPNAQSDFGPDAIESQKGEEERALGHRFLFQPTLRAMVGPVLLRNQCDVAYYTLGGRGPYQYEWEYDTLLANRDLVLADRTSVLLQLWGGNGASALLVGPAHEVVHARETELTRHRVAVQGFLSMPAGFGWTPRVYAQAGINLRDANRKGQPFLLAGVGSDIDL